MGRLSLERSPYYRFLSEDPNFKRWVSSVEEGSPNTAGCYFRRVGRICADLGKKPCDLATMNKQEAKVFIHDVIDHLRTEGNIGSTMAGYVKALKSWFIWNEIEITGRVRIKGASENPVYESEVPPKRPELRKILDVAKIRGKAIISMFAYGAFRPEVFGNAYGDDGLKMGDLPDLKVEHELDAEGEVVKGTVSFAKIPTTVNVRKKISKMGHPYFGFVPGEACEYLSNYLSWRMQPKQVKIRKADGRMQVITIKGEMLKPDSPLFGALHLNGKVTHITTPKVREEIREAITSAGYGWRPYVLRRYYEVNMLNAQYDKLVLPEWREFWTGWRGNISAVYTVNKGLPEDALETMRQAYAQAAEKHLVTVAQPTVSKEEVISTARIEALRMFGYNDQELQELGDITQITPEKLQQLIHQKSMQMLGLKQGTQKVVPLSELEHWIEQGWDYKRDLPNDKAVIGLRTS